ncbi:hypothetical protein [Streptomyces sp. NPDC006879]|uniref:hypothetical protein n=1 Tax=Streptomyces sp. NPDC006879 TaxID=3364767 RepID=UPI0036C7FFA6
MLALRLTRGSRPPVQMRRLLVATASTSVALLLLHTLVQASVGTVGSPLRLLWCLVPLAASVHLAVAVARTDPANKPRSGLSAVGLGPVRLTLITALSTAMTCAVGAVIALVLFLHLRNGILGLPFAGAAAGELRAADPLPVPGLLTLLTLQPVASAAAAALALRPREGPPWRHRETLPWGVALLGTGLAAGAYAGDGPTGILAGWTLTAVGLALAGPGLTHVCGQLLQSAQPGPLRLLAGRALQEEALRIGRPLGVLSAVLAGLLTPLTVYGPSATPEPLGTMTGPAVALVVACCAAALLIAAAESRQQRAPTSTALLDLGTPRALLRSAVTVRAAALLTVFIPLTWAVSLLTALPLTGG